MLWADILITGILMVLAGIVFIIVGILGKALLKVHGFIWVTRFGVMAIIFGSVAFAYGFLTASFN
jgi:hypothetical protein